MTISSTEMASPISAGQPQGVSVSPGGHDTFYIGIDGGTESLRAGIFTQTGGEEGLGKGLAQG